MKSLQCGNSSCDQAHSDFCNMNIPFDNVMAVYIYELKPVIDDLASNNPLDWTDFLQMPYVCTLHTYSIDINA